MIMMITFLMKCYKSVTTDVLDITRDCGGLFIKIIKIIIIA